MAHASQNVQRPARRNLEGYDEYDVANTEGDETVYHDFFEPSSLDIFVFHPGRQQKLCVIFLGILFVVARDGLPEQVGMIFFIEDVVEVVLLPDVLYEDRQPKYIYQTNQNQYGFLKKIELEHDFAVVVAEL